MPPPAKRIRSLDLVVCRGAGPFSHRRHHAGPRDVHPNRFRCDVERCGWNAGECQRRTVCRRGIGQRPTLSMAWNGSAVTLWSAAGFNSFNWWPFSDLVEPPKAYLFGFRAGPAGQVNDVHSAALWSGSFDLTDGRISVRPVGVPSPTPEPASLSLVALGLAGVGARRWRHRSHG